MLEQSEIAAKQYEATLQQLAQVNATVYSLVDLMTTTRSVFEERLNWIVESLGGTGIFSTMLVIHNSNKIITNHFYFR